MTYEAWRISHQSSEQAARAAYAECERLRSKIEAIEKERDDVAQQLVQSEIGKRKISEACDGLQAEVGKLKDLEVSRCVKINGYIVDNARLAEEVEGLQAKIEAMEQQAPLDAGSDVFRSAFEAALKAGNWPATRKGDGYRSPSTQIAWRIACSTVNRLNLYLAPENWNENKS